MPFEAGWHFTQREQRQQSLYPELQLGDLNSTFEVDRLRREEGRDPTTLGAAVESSWINNDNPDAAPRGAYDTPSSFLADPEATNPFLRMQAQESEARFAQNARLAPITDPLTSGPQGFLNSSALFAGAIGGTIDRFTGAPIRGALRNPSDPLGGAFDAFLDPSTASGRDIGPARILPDTDLWGKTRFLPDNVSLRDIAGLGIEGVSDVGAISGTAKAVAKRGAIKAGAREFALSEHAAINLPYAPAPISQAMAAFPASPAGKALFGLDDIQPGLGRGQRFRAAASEFTGVGIPDDELATPAMKMRARVQPRISAQAEQLSAQLDSVARRAFKPDSQGRIQSLPGAPTIQDVAAKRAHFYPLLNAGQRQALAEMEIKLAPVRQFLDEVGIGQELGFRADVEPGGFYLPRGNALKEGADAPFKVRAGRGGGKAGFQREAVFDSMSEGLDEGFRYAKFHDALRGYVATAGKRGVDQHVVNYLKQFGRAIPEGGVSREAGALGTPLPAQGWEFPDAITNAVNKVVRNEGDPQGAGSTIPRTLMAFNNLLRGFQSTGELSQLTIQGAVGMATDPAGYKRALGLSVRAWGPHGDELLGNYIADFNKRVVAAARPTSERWTAAGLHIGGAETEYQIGRGIAGKIGEGIRNAPLIRQSNRGFGYFGDALRLEVADTLYEEALKSGKNVADPRVMESIARTANRITGWSAKRSFGSWGEVFQYAPRFLAGRVESIVQLASKNKYDRQLARRSILRWVGTMGALTVAANEAMGNETDFDPLVERNGKTVKNPNFMRVRALGQDWSFFGTYDSLLGMMIAAGTGDVVGAGRHLLNSPVASMAWDLATGETLVGQKTRREGAPLSGLASAETAKYLASRPAPFAGPSAVQAGRDVAEGEYPEAVGNALKAGVGLRGTPLTPTEQLDRVSGGEFFKLSPKKQEEIKAEFPELWATYVEGASDTTQRREEIKADIIRRQSQVDAALKSGEIDINKWEEANKALTLESRSRRDEIMREVAKKPSDAKIVDEYFATLDAAEKPWGVDWRAFRKWENNLDPADQKTLSEYIGIGGTPFQKERRAVAANLEDAGFFKIRDDVWGAIRQGDPLAARFDSVDALRADIRKTMITELSAQGLNRGQIDLLTSQVLEKLPQLKMWSEASNKLEEAWILTNPALASQAIEYGYLNPEFLRKAEKGAVLAAQ